MSLWRIHSRLQHYHNSLKSDKSRAAKQFLSFANKMVKKGNSTPPIRVFQNCGQNRVDIPDLFVLGLLRQISRVYINRIHMTVSYFGDSK